MANAESVTENTVDRFNDTGNESQETEPMAATDSDEEPVGEASPEAPSAERQILEEQQIPLLSDDERATTKSKMLKNKKKRKGLHWDEPAPESVEETKVIDYDPWSSKRK